MTERYYYSHLLESVKGRRSNYSVCFVASHVVSVTPLTRLSSLRQVLRNKNEASGPVHSVCLVVCLFVFPNSFYGGTRQIVTTHSRGREIEKIINQIFNVKIQLTYLHDIQWQITFLILIKVNPQAYRGWGGVWMPPPSKVFLEFFQDNLLSRPVVCSSCAPIP